MDSLADNLNLFSATSGYYASIEEGGSHLEFKNRMKRHLGGPDR